MRFMISVIDDATETATSDEIQAIDAFNERLQSEGRWIFACGLSSPKTSVILDNRRGAGVVVNGPLVDSAEFVSGFWLISAPDLVTARELAAEGSECCNRKVELRQLHGE